MSHAFLAVLVPADTADVDQKVAELMASYDENRKAPEHDVPCYCIGEIAASHARGVAENLVGSMSGLRDSFWAREDVKALAKKDESDPQIQTLWKTHVALYEAVEKKERESHLMHGKPTPSCEECNGTGKRKTTANPNAKWDWYTEGGRWADIFGGECPRVSALTPEQAGAFFAVLTPTGFWRERGSMGWFGLVHDPLEGDAWPKARQALLDAHKDCLVVGIDFHI